MNRIFAILAGAGIGAALMYIFDPTGGGRRRALIKDKAVGLSNEVSETLGKKARHFSNKAQGLVHDAKSFVAVPEGGSERSVNSAGATQTF